MKLLGRTSFCIGLQIQHLLGGILLHQQAYTRKLLKFFQMDQAHALTAPIIGTSWSEDDSYRPCSEVEEIGAKPQIPHNSRSVHIPDDSYTARYTTHIRVCS